MLLKRSIDQQAALEKLLEAQRNASSPSFHKWLTPEQYADQFGLPESDMSTIRAWITSHGLSVDHSARGRNWIGVSGTAEQIAQAFGTQIHKYRVGLEEHFANATEVSVPAAFEPVVGALAGLDDFRPKPNFTNPDGTHSIVPDDLAVIYNIMPLYNGGIDGTGQTIVIVGQSDLEANLADIRTFRSRFNLPGSDPQVVLYGPDPGITGSLAEADLDIEWAGAVARNANIIYVNSTDARISALYAIDQNLGTVISHSYGSCEQESLYLGMLFQSIVQQGNVQGITYLAASGDAGATSCDAHGYEPLATNGLAALFPASIPEVTGVGGTEFNEETTQYWSVTNGPNGRSVLSYIPEIAWNDTSAQGTINASGGGASILYPKPAWQVATGVPPDSVRDSPDVAMAASASHDGYVTCTGGSCRPFGGTSVATPVFAGIVAMINQSVVSKGMQSQPGLGNINPSLYRLNGSMSNFFHDITSGDNIIPCGAGTTGCVNGSLGYSAGPGYDLVTGLGSVDATNLVNAWNEQGAQTIINIQPDKTSVLMSDNVQLTVAVKPLVGSIAPTGTLVVNLVNTVTQYSSLPGELLLGTAKLVPSASSASATVRIYGSQLTAGSNTISVTYTGDGQFNGNTATLVINASLPTTNSAVAVAAFPPTHVYQYPPIFEGPPVQGFRWGFEFKLTELAGVGTTITDFVIGAQDFSAQFRTYFGTNILPARGTLTGGLVTNIPSSPGTILVQFGGQDASGFRWTTQLTVPVASGPEQFLSAQDGGLANAASFKTTYAPGMIMSVFGNNLTTSLGTASAANIPLPLTLAGASATINGVAAPYYYSSPSFANIQIPYETAEGNAVLTLTRTSGESFNYAFRVQAAAPGIFATTDNIAVPSRSGTPGQVVFLYITGEGLASPALATGASPSASTAISDLPKPILPVLVTVGGLPAQIQFIGVTPGIVGATQINYIIPAAAPSGLQPVIVRVGGVASPAAFITVQR